MQCQIRQEAVKELLLMDYENRVRRINYMYNVHGWDVNSCFFCCKVFNNQSNTRRHVKALSCSTIKTIRATTSGDPQHARRKQDL